MSIENLGLLRKTAYVYTRNIQSFSFIKISEFPLIYFPIFFLKSHSETLKSYTKIQSENIYWFFQLFRCIFPNFSFIQAFSWQLREQQKLAKSLEPFASDDITCMQQLIFIYINTKQLLCGIIFVCFVTFGRNLSIEWKL